MPENIDRARKSAVFIDVGSLSIKFARYDIGTNGKGYISKVAERSGHVVQQGRVSRPAAFHRMVQEIGAGADSVVMVVASPSMRVDYIEPSPIEFGGGHEIQQEHIEELERRARHRLRKKHPGFDVLSLTPRLYRVDDREEGVHPLGMVAQKLSIQFMGVLLPRQELLNYRNALQSHPQLQIQDFGEAYREALTEEEVREGVAVVDIGHQLTKVVVYQGEGKAYMQVIPLGGVNIIQDVSRAFELPSKVAEKLVKDKGRAERVAGPIVFVGGREQNTRAWRVSEEQLTTVIEARIEEILSMVKQAIARSSVDVLPYGIYLTGGVAHLKDIDEKAGDVLGKAVKVMPLKSSLSGVLAAVSQREELAFSLLDACIGAVEASPETVDVFSTADTASTQAGPVPEEEAEEPNDVDPEENKAPSRMQKIFWRFLAMLFGVQKPAPQSDVRKP